MQKEQKFALTKTYTTFDNSRTGDVAAINEVLAISDGIQPYYHITTLGCQMNEHDSEKIAGILEKMGYIPSPSVEESRIIVYNTCCVRENAEKKLYGHIGALKSLKRKNPRLIIAICGCMAQKEGVADTISKKYPYVDIVFGTHNVQELPDLLYKVITGHNKERRIAEDSGTIIENIPIKRNEGIKAYVNIIYGCNNFCTYCIVPYVRGREKSRKMNDILTEIRELAATGTKEIMLLGQNVNSYGKDFPATVKTTHHDMLSPLNDVYIDTGSEPVTDAVKPDLSYEAAEYLISDTEPVTGAVQPDLSYEATEYVIPDTESGTDALRSDFCSLLYEVCRIEGIERIRFMTSHPKDLSEQLIDLIRKEDKLCKHIHLPLQSGSNKILKEMNRKYTRDEYMKLALLIREKIPGVSISTDIITGFPGETDEDFEDTLDVISKVGFDFAFTFIYSKRSGTPAAERTDEVEPETVRKRFDKLMKLLNEIGLKNNKRLIGTVKNVLVEGKSRTNENSLTGRTDCNRVVNFTGRDEQPGKLVRVRIETAQTWSLGGTALDEA